MEKKIRYHMLANLAPGRGDGHRQISGLPDQAMSLIGKLHVPVRGLGFKQQINKK